MSQPYLEPERIEYICRALCSSHLNPDALAFSTPLMDGAIYVVPENAPKLWETKIRRRYTSHTRGDMWYGGAS